MAWPPFFTLDLLALGLLPSGWDEDLIALVDAPERQIIYPSEFSPQVDGESWSFAVVSGDLLRDRCSWLLPLYLGRMLAFSASSFDRPIFVEKRLRSAISLHILCGAGARIDWHAHSNMVNGLLFVSSADEAGGGDLKFRDGDGREIAIAPKAGTFVCFDGAVDHCVTPLRSSAPRLSVPLIYFTSADEQHPAYGDDIYS
ncbi:2OG-Fe(II) oxygenase [Sphingomonas sp.]|jgi:hypothetical protein|uniref:2OG-Fe(II) oxygenase n=1 Tax=Sphingomonas sp. TaxID=28214 RepID=UPI002E3715A4|nr:2OG-Fe(II) oxygenase [Sphingomonas sp.]HEX4694825.1 2OG-Fe(II) oxygenase [Sphingomonas sp.]